MFPQKLTSFINSHTGCSDGGTSHVLLYGEGGQPVRHYENWDRIAPRYARKTRYTCVHGYTPFSHPSVFPSLSDGKSTWCRHFYIQLGSNVRRLRVAPLDGHRPEWVYTVGVEVRAGNGRYRDTLIVTLAPRFQLYNQSRHKMVFSQRCYAATISDPGAESTHLVALPQSSLAFHWPRLDRDQVRRPRKKKTH